MTDYREPSFPGIFRELEILDERQIIKKLLQVLSEWESSIRVILNHGISFDDNLDIRDISFISSSTPNTENEVAHDLGKVPKGFIVFDIDKAAHVYRGSTNWTKTHIYLKCDAASANIKAFVF